MTLRPRRAFAMAMAVLLATVVVLMSAVMIQRHAAGRLAIQRDLDAYKAHHAGRGLTEVVVAWLRSLEGQDVLELVGDDGHGFDLTLDDGTVVRVSIHDAQGSAMAETGLLPRADKEDAEGVLDHLAAIVGGPIPESYVRRVGPLKVSVRTAPEAVIDAALRQITDGEGNDEFVRDLMRERARGEVTEIFLTQLSGRAGLSVQARARVRRVMTAEPTLWRVRAEIYPRRARRPSDAFEGLAIIDRRRAGAGRGVWSPWGPFLSWERADVEPIR